jgi:hypothetical protein
LRAYVVTTGAVFGLLTAIHLWRLLEERHLAKDPWFLSITAAAAALCLWSWRVTALSREPRRSAAPPSSGPPR